MNMSFQGRSGAAVHIRVIETATAPNGAGLRSSSEFGMIRIVLIAFVAAAGLAVATPASADGPRTGFRSGAWNAGVELAPRHWRWRGVHPIRIRQTVRQWGCFPISPVSRHGWRYVVNAACQTGERVQLTFSARSGRLLSERVIGRDRFPRRGRHGRG